MGKRTGKILIVDDNAQILHALEILLRQEFERVETLRNPNLIGSYLASTDFDIVLLDMNFRAGNNSGNEGLYWLSGILKSDPLISVIMITAYGDIDLAVTAIKRGATDFISKPWDAEKLIVTLVNALEIRRSKMEVKKLIVKQQHINEDIERQFRMFRGTSGKMEAIYRAIDKVAGTDANILIQGENGTGKEVIAREIHRKSKRAGEVFLAVDMGSISESLFESEMFGHVKGSFTDAREDRAGRFEVASGGTLFMDEIGNLSLNMQAKLLGVLQNLTITRLGTSRPVPVDFRLITATNKNPEMLVQQRLFREDLLFRINTIQLEIPPLRERKEDIAGLADYYLSIFAAKYEKPFLTFSGRSYETLTEYHWAGNVRELKHTIEKAVILCDSHMLEPADFGLKEPYSKAPEDSDGFTMSDIERKSLIMVLEKCQGNISKAAKMLQISRTTLYAKIREYRI
jgi:DNA-binding NtrC family response regulator